MEGQHAIPQQISSYEFKLVGDMTLKQFLKAVGGIVIAIIIKGTGLLAIFKWPLMLISAGTGLALAFVPFEDRPLDTWLKAFLKSIYSPTIYTYKKKNDDWLDLANVKTQNDEENVIVSSNDNLFVKKEEDVSGFSSNSITKNTRDRSTTITKKANEEKQITELETGVNQNSGSGDKNIPQHYDETIGKDEAETDNWKDKSVDLNLKKEKLEATGSAVFGSIPMPDRPEIPNIIVGMATDNEGKIVDGVIIEIQDGHGNPTRVIKTNALGQFKISTPLANGRYLVIAEKEGYIFDRVNIDLKGEIVEPVRIIAHK